jgi:hypothetical protein
MMSASGSIAAEVFLCESIVSVWDFQVQNMESKYNVILLGNKD